MGNRFSKPPSIDMGTPRTLLDQNFSPPPYCRAGVTHFRGWGSVPTMRMGILRPLLTVVMAIALTACTSVLGPDQGAIERGIAIQVSQTQAEVSKIISRNSQSTQFSISHVTVENREPLMIEGIRSYRITGTYDLALQLRDRQLKQIQNPFEIFLRRDVTDETWQLARQQSTLDGAEVWMLTPLPQ